MTDYDLRRMQEAARIYNRFLGGGYERYCTPPPSLVALNPDNWTWAETWESGSVFCHGPEGTGKSSMARYLVCRYLTLWRESTDWDDMEWTAMDLYCPDLEAAVHDRSYEGAAALRRMTEHAKFCGVVLLDDLDRPRWTGAGLDVLRGILNHRHERGKTTICTTNLTPKALTDKMKEWHGGDNDGAVSLLRRLRPTKNMPFIGESYRREMIA